MSKPAVTTPTSTQPSPLSSSSSPPEPITPPNPRTRTRYPDLGRVPLHRRGTSKTYERLEDLLKEAGYKETRIFTPERGAAADDDGDGNEDQRLSVMGFLAGLMPAAPKPVIASPRPSRATAYLRHMASSASLPPQRPTSTPVHSAEQPPLPSTWLESVAKAVLFGGAGAHIGGPSSSDTQPQPEPRQTLRTTRSSLSQAHRPNPSRTGLSDQTNLTSRSQTHLAPPSLVSHIERGRAPSTQGSVTLSRVVCRSAPASRAASLARDASPGKEKDRRKRAARDVDGDRRGRGDRRKRTQRPGDHLRVPSLARTRVEGDLWSSRQRRTQASGSSVADESSASEDDAGPSHRSRSPSPSSEEEEGELTLARMLLPPKRQNSIRSLRKHLATNPEAVDAPPRSRHASKARAKPTSSATTLLTRASSLSVPSAPTSLTDTTTLTHSPVDDDEDEEDYDPIARWKASSDVFHRHAPHHPHPHPQPHRTRRNRGSDDEDADSFAGFFGVDRPGSVVGSGSGRSRTGKSRLGIGGVLGMLGTGGS